MSRPVIDVDEFGLDGQGGFDGRLPVWTEAAEATGYFERVPVTFRYPDGRLEDVVQIRLTEKGDAFLKGGCVVQ